MPSIQDIAKKNKTKMFQQTSTRPLDEVFPLRKDETISSEPKLPKAEVEKKEFKKVAYRPWDDDEPTQGEGVHPSKKKNTLPDDLTENVSVNKEQQEGGATPRNLISIPSKKIEKNSPARIIVSLYGVQRNILKFLINNISYEEDMYIYTFPIDMKSIVMYTSSGKRTVETSIRRMMEKKIIESWDHKRGRGGYVAFRIPAVLRDELLKQNNRPIQPAT